MVKLIGRGRPTKRRRNGGRRANVSLGNNRADSDRENVPDPIDIQIQISDDVTNETEEESKVCEEESKACEVEIDAEKLEKETPTNDAFYMLLRSTDLTDLISSNFCSKEYVSYGISTMLNDFSIIIGKQIQLAKEKLLQSNVNNRTDNNQLIVSVFENELDVNMLKRSFIRKATHQGKTKRDRNTVYKCLGDNYIDTLDVRYESY